jgi:hypothetical protein
MDTRNLVVGVDLGRLVDRSAFCVTERYQEVRSLAFPTREEYTDRYRVLALHKWPLLTSYSKVVKDIRSMLVASGIEEAVLAVDATGVGRDVWKMFDAAYRNTEADSLKQWPIPYFITGTGESTFGPNKYRRVTKVDLVGKLIAVLEGQLLEIPASLAHAADLERELANFRRTIAKKGQATFAANGTREHDDLVSALMLSLWHRHTIVEPRYAAAPATVAAL